VGTTLPELVFTSLAYHIDLQWLEEAYRRTRKDGTAGIDDVTGKEEEEKKADEKRNTISFQYNYYRS